MNKRKILLLLVILNLADIVTTVYGLSRGGNEINPLFSGNPFINIESLTIKIGLPLVYIGVFTVTSKLCKKKEFSKGLWLLNINLLFLVGFYLIIVANNLLGIIITSAR